VRDTLPRWRARTWRRFAGVYESWATGDFTVGALDPEAELVMRPEFPDAGTHRGVDGIAAYMRGFLEPWERITVAAEELIEVGDNVVVAVFQQGLGRGSGVTIDFRYFHVWSFRDGRAIRLEAVREREDALAAAAA
jgi:ketosteroid isomerase-like protein